MQIPDTEEQNIPIMKAAATATATVKAAPPQIDYTDTCSVCNENYNKKNHKKITCYCEMHLCVECIKTYILGKNELPHCFQCKIEWTREFMTKNITASFVKGEYSEHYRNILFKMEESQFIGTIPFIEEKKRKEIESNKCWSEINKLDDKMREINKIIAGYQDEKIKLLNKINNIERGINPETVERKKFIRKCPYGDCIGYLSTQHKCDLCNNWFCPECNELKGLDRNVEHTCNLDMVETVKLLQAECKNCPTCTSMIYKIDGCDLMWCVSCHTAFSWRTLKITNSQNIHNPHYFEWLRTQNAGGAIQRNPNDIICGRELNDIFIRNFLRRFKEKYNLTNKVIINSAKIAPRDRAMYDGYTELVKQNMKTYITFSDILESLVHIRLVDIEGRFRTIIDPNDINQRLNLRIQFMEKEIDEKRFKMELEKRNKKFEKNNQITTLLRMYITCMTDIVYVIFDELNQPALDNLAQHFNQIMNLIQYVNEQFATISRSFNSVKYCISPEFDWKVGKP